MTVKELEQQLQIPRANIRYYEREGLLRPQRGENNYRDYTAEDVATLEKIRLLRQLDMPVETIRAVQTGELPLRDALSHQSSLLSGEAARLEHSRAVCRAMLNDGADYATLDTGRYRRAALSAPAAPPPTPERHPPVDGAVWALSPWQRWWARSFDFSIVDAICALFFSLVFRISEQNAPELVMSLLTAILSWLLIALLEPFLLSTWGTTPGKWLMGLELRDETGKKLSFGAALWRVGGIFSHGYGFNIPIYNLVRNYRCYQDCKAGREMPYDEDEGHLYYSLPGDRWFWRAAVSLAATVLLLAPVELFANYQVLVPPNRDDITAEEFWENVDYMGDPRQSPRWRISDNWPLTETAPLPSGGITYHYACSYLDATICTLETDSRGFVTAVAVTSEGTGVSAAGLPLDSLIKFAAALQGTEFTGLGIVNSKITRALNSDHFSNQLWNSRNSDSLTHYEGPFTLTAQLKCSGIDSLRFGALYATDNLNQGSFHFTARLEK